MGFFSFTHTRSAERLDCLRKFGAAYANGSLDKSSGNGDLSHLPPNTRKRILLYRKNNEQAGSKIGVWAEDKKAAEFFLLVAVKFFRYSEGYIVGLDWTNMSSYIKLSGERLKKSDYKSLLNIEQGAVSEFHRQYKIKQGKKK